MCEMSHQTEPASLSQKVDLWTAYVGHIHSIDEAKQKCLEVNGELPADENELSIDYGHVMALVPVANEKMECPYQTFLRNNQGVFSVYTLVDNY